MSQQLKKKSLVIFPLSLLRLELKCRLESRWKISPFFYRSVTIWCFLQSPSLPWGWLKAKLTRSLSTFSGIQKGRTRTFHFGFVGHRGVCASVEYENLKRIALTLNSWRNCRIFKQKSQAVISKWTQEIKNTETTLMLSLFLCTITRSEQW